MVTLKTRDTSNAAYVELAVNTVAEMQEIPIVEYKPLLTFCLVVQDSSLYVLDENKTWIEL